MQIIEKRRKMKSKANLNCASKNQVLGWNYSIMDRVYLNSCMSTQIPDIPYGPQTTTRKNSWVQSLEKPLIIVECDPKAKKILKINKYPGIALTKEEKGYLKLKKC